MILCKTAIGNLRLEINDVPATKVKLSEVSADLSSDIACDRAFPTAWNVHVMFLPVSMRKTSSC